ncbi:hypothetical protein [Pseudomonas sp. Irchel 3A7]|uniref:hypothetical protein n=1 Tax=Pseudomonas sp. Irchel 3A7 TaxID=2008913 RepID=UPI000BA3D2B6|nr:hypothetical protein [Pseudomonas sp. Irchel 3A7]
MDEAPGYEWGVTILRYQTEGGDHTQVGRPVQEPGASEDALRTATIKSRVESASAKGSTAHLNKPGYQTRSLFFSDRQTIEAAPQAHKPADSGVTVGNDARLCSFQEMSVRPVKHATLEDV